MDSSRRVFVGAAGAAGLVSVTGAPLSAWAADKKLVVGVLYVGPRDDFGYNQAQAQAAAILKKMPNIKVVEEEKVAETVAVQKSMEAMINQDKAQLIFATSFGYFDPHMLKVAEKYPNVRFMHCGGMWTEGKHPKNTGSYFGYIDGAQYVAGVVAGHMSKKKKLGFIAAKPIPQVLRNINAFTMGARSVDPSFTTQVIFTGDWSLPGKEAEAILEDFQHTITGDFFATFGVLFQQRKDHVLLARTGHVFQAHLLSHFQQFDNRFLLEFGQIHRLTFVLI